MKPDQVNLGSLPQRNGLEVDQFDRPVPPEFLHAPRASELHDAEEWKLIASPFTTPTVLASVRVPPDATERLLWPYFSSEDPSSDVWEFYGYLRFVLAGNEVGRMPYSTMSGTFATLKPVASAFSTGYPLLSAGGLMQTGGATHPLVLNWQGGLIGLRTTIVSSVPVRVSCDAIEFIGEYFNVSSSDNTFCCGFRVLSCYPARTSP